MILNCKKVTLLVTALAAPLLVTGCARNIASNNFTEAHVGEAMTSYAGIVIAKRTVTVQEADKLSGNALGLVGGGVAGGVIGNQFGGGRGSNLATLAGAALGATAGALAQQELTKQNAYEYTIQLDNGTLKTVVQGLDVSLNKGQRVLLHMGRKGRSRIVPLA